MPHCAITFCCRQAFYPIIEKAMSYIGYRKIFRNIVYERQNAGSVYITQKNCVIVGNTKRFYFFEIW